MIKIGKFEYKKSTRKNKKLSVVVDDKTIHFGDSNSEHYFDKTGLLDKNLNHNNNKRRENYLRRAKGIKNKQGDLTWKDPTSPNYHSIRILW